MFLVGLSREDMDFRASMKGRTKRPGGVCPDFRIQIPCAGLPIYHPMFLGNDGAVGSLIVILRLALDGS